MCCYWYLLYLAFFSHVDPTLLKKGIGYLFYLFSTALHQETPSINLLRCLIQAVIPVYRIALTRAVKIGIIESGVAVRGQNGIAADSAADVALETFRNVASLKDEIVRLVLPSSVPGQSAFGFMRSPSVNDGVRSNALTLAQVSFFVEFFLRLTFVISVHFHSE